MSTINFEQKRRDFLDTKYREMPELREKDVDELLQDLIRDGRSTTAI